MKNNENNEITKCAFDNLNDRAYGIDVGDDLSFSLGSICAFSEQEDSGLLNIIKTNVMQA